MTLLTWDAPGERIFETAVDRGVLYPATGPGVAWNGLVAVKEKASGGTPVKYYYDGRQYLAKATPSEFEATLEAYTYPIEFEECDGTAILLPGILVTQQAQKSFGLSYRTLIGNDISGIDYGYKIHLVYNALATLSEKNYATQSNTVSPHIFAWDLVATPIDMPGLRPSAHIIIDSTRLSEEGLALLEGILYGADGPPRLPTPDEILELYGVSRLIIVLATPDEELLPEDAILGDIVFAISDEGVYSVGDPASPYVRDVIVIPGDDLDMLPDDAYPGDIVYDETTGILYQIGE